MQFHGGSVGHKSTCSATTQFLTDHDACNEEYAAREQEMGEDSDEESNNAGDFELTHGISPEPEIEPDSTDDESDNSDEDLDEELHFEYAQHASDVELEEENDGEGEMDMVDELGAEDGDGWKDIEELGFANW